MEKVNNEKKEAYNKVTREIWDIIEKLERNTDEKEDERLLLRYRDLKEMQKAIEES